MLARLGVVALLSLSPEGLQDNVAIQFNSNVLLFTTLMALSTGIIFGLAPAWRSSRLDLDQVLRQNSRGSVAGHGRTGRLLVIGQISLSLVLLIAAALLMSSFRRLLTQENTLRREGVYTFRVDLSGPKYERGEQRANFNRELGSALTALPGVEATGAISKLPLTGPYHGWGFRIPGRDPESEQGGGPAQIRVVDRDYFQALRIPLLRGRLLDSSDRADSSPSVLINRALADRYFEDEDAVGKVLSMGGNRTVVGVVGNVRHRHLLPASPKIYVAHAQFADNRNWQLYQIVLTTTERADIFALIRQQVGRLDSGLAIFGAAEFSDVVAEGIAQQRFATTLMTLFGVLALLLAGVGIHGILTQIFGARAREFAIRMALGAEASKVLRIVFRETLIMGSIGIGLGLAGGVLATRWLENMLYEVSPTEPSVFSLVGLFLLGATLVVGYFPARRAFSLSPVDVLRNE